MTRVTQSAERLHLAGRATGADRHPQRAGGGGRRGSRLHTEQLALGSTANLAARVAAAAAPGTVMISEVTARRAGGVFVVEPLDLHALKGLPSPVAAFRPTAPRGICSRVAAWLGGSGRVLLGRDALLARLLTSWSAASTGSAAAVAGKASLVVLRGEAGIGKSRLLQALRQRLTDERHGWISCHASSLQQASRFYPVIEAMRDSLGLDGGASWI